MRVINAIINAIKAALMVIGAYIALAVWIVLSLIASEALATDEEIAQELADMKAGKWRKK